MIKDFELGDEASSVSFVVVNVYLLTTYDNDDIRSVLPFDETIE